MTDTTHTTQTITSEDGDDIFTKTWNKLNEKGPVSHFHADWGPEAVNMTAEERAEAIFNMLTQMDDPIANVISLLEGRHMLLSDSAHQSYDTQTMSYVPVTGKQRDAAQFASLIRDAIGLLEQYQKMLKNNATAKWVNGEERDETAN